MPTTADTKKDYTRLTMLDRVQLAKRIIAAREKAKPDSWPTIAKREAVSERTIRRIYAETVDRRQKLNDPTGQAVVGETLALYEEGLEFLTSVVANEEVAWSTRVAAFGKILETTERRFQLLVVSGRMPRNIAASNDRQQAELILRRVIEILAKHGVSGEVLDELIEMTSDREQRALASG